MGAQITHTVETFDPERLYDGSDVFITQLVKKLVTDSGIGIFWWVFTSRVKPTI